MVCFSVFEAVPGTESSCAKGYTVSDSDPTKCLSFQEKVNATFFEAYMSCALNGGQLASIQDTTTNNQIKLKLVIV